MINPLTSLDELIWQQFEKVTVAANKKLGWNKYDLATASSGAASVSALGSGLYSGIYGFLKNEITMEAIGGALVIIGSQYYFWERENNKHREQAELEKIVRAGAAQQPVYNALRPLALGFWSVAIVRGGEYTGVY